MICFYCQEPVLDGEESGNIANAASHRECAFRSIAGSVAHIEGRCSCFGTRDEGDPPGMSPREAARAALAAYRRVHEMRMSGGE